jgi:two-component system chemotaxis response regulator CheB
MPRRDVVVVGASAGGVEALSQLVARLPPALPASLFVVLHLPAGATSVLPRILSRRGPLPAAHPRDDEPIESGHIYVAPPDQHLLVSRGRVRVVHGPRENGHRPAVDPLFRSAAEAYGKRVIGVVLSGTLDDGTAGLLAVKAHGGLALVQDPSDALFAGMPRSALDNVPVDHCLALADLAPVLSALVEEQVDQDEPPVSDGLSLENELTRMDLAAINNTSRLGAPSVFTCPECQGTLWEMQDGELLRFRCRVGHAYAAESLAAGQSERLEMALWTALRALEEQTTLASRLAERARERGHTRAEATFAERELEAQHSAALIRDVLEKNPLFDAGDGKGPNGPRAGTPRHNPPADNRPAV